MFFYQQQSKTNVTFALPNNVIYFETKYTDKMKTDWKNRSMR